MDLREKKTIRSIENAFLQLRAKKPLERITVKELVELAEVSKSTFYAHYQDVYDLSGKMQKDVIKEIYDSIQSAELFFSNPIQFAHESFRAFLSHREVTDILFTGRQYYDLAFHVEQGVKEFIFQRFPELRKDVEFNVWLSFGIQGSFYAYIENHESFGDEKMHEMVSEIGEKMFLPFSVGLKSEPSDQ